MARVLVTGASSGIGRATAAERGLIVNVSTVGGRTPARGYHALYQGSKHALRAASEALVWELAPFGVSVALIEPGLKPRGERPASSAAGVHHLALLSSDVERTIRFYQDVLEFPLTEIFENRDYRGSTPVFFDIGHGNALAFFDFPGLDLGPYREVSGNGRGG